MNLLYKIMRTTDSRLVIFIRFMVGLVFLLEGIQKFLYPDDRGAGRFAKIGLPNPEILGPFVGAAETIAGALILIGLLVRPAALTLIIIMAVAIFTTKLPILFGQEFFGFQPRELKYYGFMSMAHEMRTDWSMLLGSIYLLLAGGGRWSVDRMWAPKVESTTSTESRDQQ